MNRLVLLLTLSLLTLTGTGCSNRSRAVIGGPDAEEAVIRMEESRQEYNDCIAQIHPGPLLAIASKRFIKKIRPNTMPKSAKN